jgi:hypothetical protein
MGWGHQATRPTRRAGERRPGSGCRPQPHRRGGGGLLDVGSDSTRSLPSAEPSRDAGTTPPAGLATQPVPGRPGRGRTRLRPRRTARQHQRRRSELDTTWPSLRKAVGRHGLGMPARNPEAVRQRAIEAARQRSGQSAIPTLDPVFRRSTLASSRPESGRRLSCMSGSAATSSTRPSGPTWWSSCTARATPASQPPGPGRSSDGLTAAIGWPANAPAAPTVARPIEPTPLAGPTNLWSGRWRPILADPTARPAGQRAAIPRLSIDVVHDPRRRWVMSYWSAVPRGGAYPTRNQPINWPLGESPRASSRPVPAGVGTSREQAVSIRPQPEQCDPPGGSRQTSGCYPFSQPQPSPFPSRPNGSGGRTRMEPSTYSGPLPDPSAQS